MAPFLVAARFRLPVHIENQSWLYFCNWLSDRDSYLISAWGTAAHAVVMVDDLETAFSELRSQLEKVGLDDLTFVELGARWSTFEREPDLEPYLLAFDSKFLLYGQ